jgi:DNA-binding transcriptional regulator YdaS (Cro superfamily)
MSTNHHIIAAIKQAGSEARLASQVGCSQPAINKLKFGAPVSANMAVKIEAATGIPRHELRPDLWDAPFLTQDGTKLARTCAHTRENAA